MDAFLGGSVWRRGERVTGKGVWSELGADPPPSSLVSLSSRNHWDPHERSRAACVSHPATKAGPSPTPRQQERNKIHPRGFQHKPQDHQEASQERYQPPCQKESWGGGGHRLAPSPALSPPLRVTTVPSLPWFLHLLNGLTNSHSEDYTKVDRFGSDGDPLRNREIQGNNTDT